MKGIIQKCWVLSFIKENTFKENPLVTCGYLCRGRCVHFYKLVSYLAKPLGMQCRGEKCVRKWGERTKEETYDSWRGHCRNDEKGQGNVCFPAAPGARGIHCHAPPWKSLWCLMWSPLRGRGVMPCWLLTHFSELTLVTMIKLFISCTNHFLIFHLKQKFNFSHTGKTLILIYASVIHI